MMFIVYCRPSAIPGPVPDEIVLPATESVGLFQLVKNIVCANGVIGSNSNFHSPCFLLLNRCEIAAEDGMATRSFN